MKIQTIAQPLLALFEQESKREQLNDLSAIVTEQSPSSSKVLNVCVFICNIQSKNWFPELAAFCQTHLENLSSITPMGFHHSREIYMRFINNVPSYLH